MSNTVNRQVWEKILGDQKAIQDFRSFHWEGNFFEYLDLVKKNPSVTRNAFQRMYDLILSFGTTSYVEYKKTIVRYKFFDDPIDQGKDAVFGLDVPLMKLVHFFKFKYENLKLYSVLLFLQNIFCVLNYLKYLNAKAMNINVFSKNIFV